MLEVALSILAVAGSGTVSCLGYLFYQRALAEKQVIRERQNVADMNRMPSTLGEGYRG